MSTATDYLTKWINQAAQGPQRSPSITRVTAQSWPGVGYQNFKPGIASYGWGIDGQIIRNGNGNPIGLSFGEIWVWFSDRGLDLVTNPPFYFGQQFIANESDLEQMSFTVAGDQVQLEVVLKTWNTQYVVTTSTCDQSSQQLIFSGVPGAGPNAPQALLIVSFADTGDFGWE